MEVNIFYVFVLELGVLYEVVKVFGISFKYVDNRDLIFDLVLADFFGFTFSRGYCSCDKLFICCMVYLIVVDLVFLCFWFVCGLL